MFRKLRNWARTFIYLDMLFYAVWCVVAATFGTLFLIVAVIQGDWERSLSLLGTAAGSAAILGFFYWVYRDARKASKEMRRQRRQSRPRPDGDMSDVAGLPQRPPWMG